MWFALISVRQNVADRGARPHLRSIQRVDKKIEQWENFTHNVRSCELRSELTNLY